MFGTTLFRVRYWMIFAIISTLNTVQKSGKKAQFFVKNRSFFAECCSEIGLFAQKARYIALWRKKKVGNFGKLYNNVYICAEYIVRAYA